MGSSYLPTTTDNNRQQPTTTVNNRQQTVNNRQQTDNYRQQVFLKRYFQIKRDFYDSLPLKRLYKVRLFERFDPDDFHNMLLLLFCCCCFYLI